ncbi:putative LOC100572414 [Trichonephila clavipes]|nr:putative LOC100572414 [Trichonephila clavipes]
MSARILERVNVGSTSACRTILQSSLLVVFLINPEPVFRACQVIYSQFGLAIHQNDHQARRRFVEWAQNEIAVVPDLNKRILFSDEAHFWLNGYVNKQNCRIWSEANPQVYVETPLHPEKLTVGALYGLVESLVRTSSKTMKATTLQLMVIAV